MRRIIRRREIVADSVRYPGETPDITLRAVQPMAEFLSSAPQAAAGPSADASADAGADAAVLVGPADEVERLAAHLQRIGLIVIDFTKAGEGRGFSQARLLRQRYHYEGELRARGALKRDQLFFLARCGFDSFDLDGAEDLSAALSAFDTFSVAYQDGSDAIVHVRRRQLV